MTVPAFRHDAARCAGVDPELFFPERTLCELTEHFAITPGMDIRTATCVVCLDLDDVARRECQAQHPSRRSTVDTSDQGQVTP